MRPKIVAALVLFACSSPPTADPRSSPDPSLDASAPDAAAMQTDAAKPAPPCPVVAPCVLFYGPIVFDADPTPFDPSVYDPFEKPYLPAGSKVTIADDATWASMSTADFAKFNLILIGDNLDWHPHPQYLDTAFETRAVWNPAITGRAVVQGIDAGFHSEHSNNPSAARAYLRAVLTWLASGPGTALYVSSIARDYDYLGDIGAFTSGSDQGDTVTLDEPTHPIFAASSSDSLSNWVITYHRTCTAFPADFRGVASAASKNTVVLVRDR